MKSEKIIREMKEMRGIKKSYEIYKEIDKSINVLDLMSRFFNCFSVIKRVGSTTMIVDKHCYLCAIIENRHYSLSFESNYISIECKVFDK